MQKRSTNLQTDAELVKAVAGRDKAAFSKLYDKYAQAVFSMVSHVTNNDNTAEEILQRTFCELWHTAADYDPAGNRFFAWILHRAGNITRQVMSGEANTIRNEKNYVHHSEENNKFESLNIKKAFLYICTKDSKDPGVAANTGLPELKLSLREECNTIRHHLNEEHTGLYHEWHY